MRAIARCAAIGTAVRTALSTFFAALGLALALFLAILKIAHWPCHGGGCEAVIHSSYGTWLGLPVGLYASVLWLGVFLLPSAGARLACQGLLALGSLAFAGLQVFVLRAFCPYCLAHAVAAWLALPLHRCRPHRWGLLVGLAAAGILAAWAANPHRAASLGRPALAGWVQRQPNGLYWLGERDPKSPALVLSLDCPACLYLLQGIVRQDRTGPSHPHGPALYFKTDAKNRALTAVFVSAVQAQPGKRRDAFLGLTTLVLAHQDLLLGDPTAAATTLRSLLPSSDAGEAEATALLARQAQDLAAVPVLTTPFLARPDGSASDNFSPEEIYP